MDKEIIDVFVFAKNHEHINKEDELSVLETIWKFHGVHGAIADDSVQEKIQMIQPYIKTLSERRKRIIMARIADLCVEYERAAFMEGMRVGGRLVMELRGEEKIGWMADRDE